MPNHTCIITAKITALQNLKDQLGPPSARQSLNPHIDQGTPLSHLFIDYGPDGEALRSGYPRFSKRSHHQIRLVRRRLAQWEAAVASHALAMDSKASSFIPGLGHEKDALRACTLPEYEVDHDKQDIHNNHDDDSPKEPTLEPHNISGSSIFTPSPSNEQGEEVLCLLWPL